MPETVFPALDDGVVKLASDNLAFMASRSIALNIKSSC